MSAREGCNDAAVVQGAPAKHSRVWPGIVALGFVAAAGLIAPRLGPQPGVPVAAVFPPWWSQTAVVAAAARTGVEIVARGRLPNTILVSADNSHALAELYRAGAWSLIDASGLGGCFVARPQDVAEGRP